MGKNYSKKYVLLFTLLLASVMAFAQSGSISGKVVDEKNLPLPGATVTIDGTTLGGATDVNGNYTIRNVRAGNYTLTAKFIGYNSLQKTVTVNSGNEVVSFSLQPETRNINEVVVIGYGTARKKDLTGSVVSVTSKDFNQGPITTPEQLITGKVAGVQITSNSGQPGVGSTIRIRGGASLSASNDPLIVIDGLPVANTTSGGIGNPLASINPDDIESFNVLKDASATAIYGSRASNGVIIITTKKGQSNSKLSVNVSALESVSEKTKEVSVLSADQFRQVVNANGGASQVALLGKASTNWQDVIYQTGRTHDYNINFTGGIKGLPYRLSVGYYDQDGILKTDNFKRNTAALSINPTFLHNSLKVDLNVKGTYTNSRFGNQAAIGSAIGFDPTQPVYSGNSNYGGYFEWLSGGTPNTLAPRNPLGLLEQANNTGTNRRGIGSLALNYTFPFLKELQANATFGGDLSDGQGHNYTPATAAASFASQGNFNRYFNENYTYNTDYYLRYSNDFKDIKSHLDVTAGYSYQYFSYYTRGETYYAANGTTVVPGAYPAFNGAYYIESPFARLNFNYNSKYYITATIRDDRSSRFSDLHRNGYFPSISAAWNIKEEDFMKGVGAVSDLKLRGGYGITGQQDIGNGSNGSYFPYLARYTPGDAASAYQFGSVFIPTLRPEAYNEDIRWEQTATTNVALDYGLFNGRINGSLEWYQKKTKDLLLDTPIPDGTNLTNHLFANIGNLKTDGIDFNMNVIAVNQKDLNWTFGYNISYNKIRITNLSLTSDPNATIATGGIGGGVGNTIQAWKVGYSPYTFYVYQQVYNQSGAPLEGVYVDRNNNGGTTDDKYLYKHANPSVYMGFNSSLTYKKWNLGFTLRANLNNYVYNNFAAANGAYAGFKFSGYLGNISSTVLDTKFNNYQIFSDYYIENASFLRMDNANLSYNFGKIAKVGTLRASLNVQNVFVITKYKGIDPEITSTSFTGSNPQASYGIDNNFYPRPRTFSVGLNLGF